MTGTKWTPYLSRETCTISPTRNQPGGMPTTTDAATLRTRRIVFSGGISEIYWASISMPGSEVTREGHTSEFVFHRWDSVAKAYFDPDGHWVSVGQTLGRALNAVLDHEVLSWTDIECLRAPVYGGMGTQIARAPSASTGVHWGRFRGEPNHLQLSVCIEIAAGGWDTLRRTLNRARPTLGREAQEIWGVARNE